MWMCRRCAAHVKDSILHCPCCGTPAPARLHSELAEYVSTEQETFSPPKPSTPFLLPRLPMLQRQWEKRAVDAGALVGFFGCLAFSVLAHRSEPDGSWHLLELVGVIFFHLIPALGWAFFSALAGWSLATLASAIAEFIDRRFSRADSWKSLSVHAVLTKTDSLGQPATDDSAEEITTKEDRLARQAHVDCGIRQGSDLSVDPR